MPMIDVTNIAKGPRGVNAVDGLVMLRPGETRSVDLSPAELKSAISTGDFAFGDETPADPLETPLDDLDTTVDKLKALAKAEGVDLEAIEGTGAGGRVLKADLQDAIRAKRASAAVTSGDDNLDDLDDAALRDTVAVLTGEPAPEGADRDTLLRLARGVK